MAVLLGQAIQPNLVQSLEGTPAFVHGGPFANIAHGCNSVLATRTALRLADFVVTEAGFGADLGAEKFFDIKCRQAGLSPAAAVVVASVRALKFNGGVPRAALGAENLDALRAGLPNLLRHVGNVQGFGVPAVVAINRFGTDTEAELALVQEAVAGLGVQAFVCTHWADGSAGAEPLAEAVAALAERGTARFAPLYPDAIPREPRQRAAQGAGATACVGGCGPRPSAGVHGQDALFLHRRPRGARRARRVRAAGERRAPVGGGGIRGGAVRRGADDARSAAGAGRREHPLRGGRAGGGPVLRPRHRLQPPR
jgi:hypothetical protein